MLFLILEICIYIILAYFIYIKASPIIDKLIYIINEMYELTEFLKKSIQEFQLNNSSGLKTDIFNCSLFNPMNSFGVINQSNEMNKEPITNYDLTKLLDECRQRLTEKQTFINTPVSSNEFENNSKLD